MVEPLDVAIFVPGLLAGGGAEKTALSVAVALRDSGLMVACFTDARVDPIPLSDHFGIALHDITFRQLPARVVSSSRAPQALVQALEDRRALRAIRRSRPRLFVNMKFKSSMPGAGATNWYFTHFPHPLSVTPRSPQHRAYLTVASLARQLLLHPRSRHFIETYDLVTGNSAFTSQHVAMRWGVDAETLYPPCELTIEPEPSRPRERIILGVGRFQAREEGVPHKNQHVMVKAFAQLDDLIAAGWELHLVGTVHGPSAEAYFRELRSLSAHLPIVLHENASKSELDDLHRRASIYWHAQGFDTDQDVFPEAQEHFGISTVEAMSAGVIPLVYASAGPLEVVAPVGPQLTWTTITELVAASRSIAAVADTTACRSACVDRAMDFGGDAFAARVLEIWTRLAGRRTRTCE